MLPRVENLRSYVFTALRSAAAKIAAARDKQRRDPLPDPSKIVAPAAEGVEIELSVRLERALLQLPAEQQELVSLKVDAGLTFAEIASCLGINANTAASRYRYAIEKLRAAVEGTSHEPSRIAP
jgi:RNA polymerase sigma-70 factor (ECF subfamily)